MPPQGREKATTPDSLQPPLGHLGTILARRGRRFTDCQSLMSCYDVPFPQIFAPAITTFAPPGDSSPSHVVQLAISRIFESPSHLPSLHHQAILHHHQVDNNHHQRQSLSSSIAISHHQSFLLHLPFKSCIIQSHQSHVVNTSRANATFTIFILLT